LNKAFIIIPIGVAIFVAFMVVRNQQTTAEEHEEIQRLIAEEQTKNEEMVRVTEQEIFKLVNDARQQRNRTALIWDDSLAERARTWANKLAEAKELVHSPEGYYSLIIVCEQEGENLVDANPDADPEKIVNSWIMSPSHFQNLLQPWRYTGVGYANGFIVQAFCA